MSLPITERLCFRKSGCSISGRIAMYKIGDLNIDILHISKDQFLVRLVPFYIKDGQADVTYEFQYSSRISIPGGSRILYRNAVSLVTGLHGRIIQFHIAEGIPYAMAERVGNGRYHITVPEDIIEHELHHYVLPDLLHLEQPLLEKNCLVLHSSYIYVPELEGAVLFTAPSGGGKSTQANLWETYKGARIINGDKSIIGQKDGEWRAYGIPFSGASGHCLNESYLIRAVVILKKGCENTLTEAGVHGVTELLPQVTFDPWDRRFCERALDLLTVMCGQVPVYVYSCTAGPDAAEVLYQELAKRED